MRETLILRDFTPYIPEKQTSEVVWETRDYRLLDLTFGRMLWANGAVKDNRNYDDAKVPCTLEIDPHLEGLYDIVLGIPLIKEKPCLLNGVDVALDGETFVHLSYQYGVRYGERLTQMPCEYWVRFKCAQMTGRKIQIRIPFGTFMSIPAGYVQASLSAIKFTPIEKTAEKRPSSKAVGVVCDGFSHYFTYAKPGDNLDLRLPETYGGTDVKMLFHQITSLSLWKSNVTYYFGEAVTEAEMANKRSGDRRVCDYIKWAVNTNTNILDEQVKKCRAGGIQSHFSIRANLYWGENSEYFTATGNGKFWVEHPECRVPGTSWLNYDLPIVQDYYLTLYREALDLADFEGLNMDLTRWPPIFRKGHNTKETLIVFLKRLRGLADEYAAKRGHKIAVSILAVEDFHAGNATLEDQLIDLEAVLAANVLDFVCVQTPHIEKYVPMAHAHGTPIYAIHDQDGAFAEGGYKNDPLWTAPQFTKEDVDDPKAGEEYRAEPIIRSDPAPWEIAILADNDYNKGADGIILVNRFMGDRTLSDLGDPVVAHEHAEKRTAFGQEQGDYLFVLKP